MSGRDKRQKTCNGKYKFCATSYLIAADVAGICSRGLGSAHRPDLRPLVRKKESDMDPLLRELEWHVIDLISQDISVGSLSAMTYELIYSLILQLEYIYSVSSHQSVVSFRLRQPESFTESSETPSK